MNRQLLWIIKGGFLLVSIIAIIDIVHFFTGLHVVDYVFKGIGEIVFFLFILGDDMSGHLTISWITTGVVIVFLVGALVGLVLGKLKS